MGPYEKLRGEMEEKCRALGVSREELDQMGWGPGSEEGWKAFQEIVEVMVDETLEEEECLAQVRRILQTFHLKILGGGEESGCP